MRTTNSNSSVQLSLFPLDGTSVNDAQTACIPAGRVSNYLKTREALWRMLASYPKGMTVEDAVRRARVDFTRCSAPAPLACYQRDARKEVAS